MQLCINSYKEYRLYALLVHYEVVALMVHLHLYIICLIYLANQHVSFFFFRPSGYMNRILKMSTIHPQMTWIRNLNQRMNFLQKIKRLLSIREFSVRNSPLYLLFPFFQLRVCKHCIRTGLRIPRDDDSGSPFDSDSIQKPFNTF